MEETVGSINISETITNTINNLFSNLFSSIDNTLYPMLDDITFISTDILTKSNLREIIGNGSSNGIILICNSLILGFLLYYSANLLLSYYNCAAPIQKPSQFIFKLLICSILMNYSYFICEQIIEVCSFLSLGIREIGENLYGKEMCFSTLISELNSAIYLSEETLNIFSFDGLIKCFVSFGLINLIFSYTLRYVMLLTFTLVSPFAILSLCFNNSSWFFKIWLRFYLSLLFLQIFISIIFLVTFTVNFSSTHIGQKLLCIGSIYALSKANGYIREFMGGISTEFNVGINNIKSFFKGV